MEALSEAGSEISRRYLETESSIMGLPHVGQTNDLLPLGEDIKEKIKQALQEMADILGEPYQYTWNDFFDDIKKLIAGLVSDNVLLKALDILSFWGTSTSTSEEHYQSNVYGWINYLESHNEDTYIEHQEDMNEIKYGNDGTASDNACEVIAVYNALLYLNDGEEKVSFPDLLRTFEADGCCLGGFFGTVPSAMDDYLTEQGYDTVYITGSDITNTSIEEIQNNYSTYILTAYNEADNFFEQIHTVSITQEMIDGNIKYVVHNGDVDSNYNPMVYDSLNEAVDQFHHGEGAPLSVIGVREHEN